MFSLLIRFASTASWKSGRDPSLSTRYCRTGRRKTAIAAEPASGRQNVRPSKSRPQRLAGDAGLLSLSVWIFNGDVIGRGTTYLRVQHQLRLLTQTPLFASAVSLKLWSPPLPAGSGRMHWPVSHCSVSYLKETASQTDSTRQHDPCLLQAGSNRVTQRFRRLVEDVTIDTRLADKGGRQFLPRSPDKEHIAVAGMSKTPF